jgi:DNA invertase Pin-like site-specific DNA recombinase
MKLIYIRVSSKDQNEQRQVDAMIAAGLNLENVYMDKQSGKDFNRPEYKAMLKAARSGDTIVIKSIDRLGRNYAEVKDQFNQITERGIFINVLDTPILNTDQVIAGGLTMKFINDLVLSVLGYVAEQERNNIHQRQAEGIKSAMNKGIKFGRPTKQHKDFTKLSESVKAGKLTVVQACQIMQISRKTYYNHAKAAGLI